MALLANLTLLPALLAICGRAVFWPRIPVAGPGQAGDLGADRRQGGQPARADPGHRPGHPRRAGPVHAGLLADRVRRARPLPAASDSAKGQALLAAHYPTAESDPTDVLFRLPGLGVGRAPAC